MPISNVQLKTKFAVTLNQASGSNEIILGDTQGYIKSGYRVISESFTITNLKAISYINSLAVVDFPVFTIESTESEQLFAALNIEWGSERFHLELLFRTEQENPWQKIGMYSLLNPSPYPYREYELGNHELGSNADMAVKISNVGYGTLQSNDSVVVFGEMIHDVVLERLVDTSVKIANNITTIASTLVNANTDRIGLTFFNSSDKDIYIDTVNTVSISSHMIKLEPGDYYEAPTPLYTGAYWAIVSSGSTAIDVREFV